MTEPSNPDPRRRLPALDHLLAEPTLVALGKVYGRASVAIQARLRLAELRSLTADELASDELATRLDALPARIAGELASDAGRAARRVLNATGIFLHTNLGRSPLPAAVAARLPSLLTAGSDVELDLDSGRRGERNRRAASLLVRLTGAEAACVVNNNAAALVLALATLARGREVLVSRGELVEIGGSFRIPEIAEAAGARLVEVGTTNRTRLADYERAIGRETALLLKVHASNYRISGFVAEVGAGALAALAARHGLELLVDEGAGLLRPSPRAELADHPSLAELVAAGAGLVCGSADKLVGGPQAGLLVGRRELVARAQSDPLYRALRPDRITFVTLEAVLREHLADRPLPIDRLWTPPAELAERLARLAEPLAADIVPAEAFVGGGAAPERAIPGLALAIPDDGRLADALRKGDPAVVGYLDRGRLHLDLRTIDPADDAALVAAVQAAREALG